MPPPIAPLPETAIRPLFSVMIPAYNCMPYLAHAVKSVLCQDLGEGKMQIEVVDDASTDGDVEHLVKTLGMGRVAYYRQSQHVGSLRNFETCINRAWGYYVHLLHGDDLVKPGFYEEIERLFQLFPDIGSAITNFNWTDENGVERKPNDVLMPHRGIIKNWLQKIASRQFLQPPAVVVKRAVYEALGSFYGVHYGEDWEMWIRIAAHYPVAYSPSCLATYRGGHTTNISAQSVTTGKNLADLRKVIDLVQPFLPAADRQKLRRRAYQNFSNSYAKGAYRYYTRKNDLAMARVLFKAAFELSWHPRTIYSYLRFLAARARRGKK